MKLNKLIPLLCFIALSSACTSPVVEKETTVSESTPYIEISGYDFPSEIDPQSKYVFYLHGKIIEDQGIPAISPDYGEYQYQEILDVFEGYGFKVISELREKETDSFVYAQKVSGQINTLLASGVPAENISVIGASKGAGIALLTSNLIAEEEINYVLLSICHPDVVQELIEADNRLYGRVLSIFEAGDEYAGSCMDLFAYSENQGLIDYDEIILNIGLGHGIVYQPMDEWVLPSVQWINGEVLH